MQNFCYYPSVLNLNVRVASVASVIKFPASTVLLLVLLLLLILVIRQHSTEVSFNCTEVTPTFVKLCRLIQKSKLDAPINTRIGDVRSLHFFFWLRK